MALKRAKSARPDVTESMLFARMCLAYAHGMLGDTTVAERDLKRCLVAMGEKFYVPKNSACRYPSDVTGARHMWHSALRANTPFAHAPHSAWPHGGT